MSATGDGTERPGNEARQFVPNPDGADTIDGVGTPPTQQEGAQTLDASPGAEERQLLRSASERYALQGELGRGGMGAVYRLLDQDIHRSVAMKVILGENDGDRATRFVEEARVTGQLEHPGIPPVHELGLDPKGRLYFTMKLVQGRSLDDVIEASSVSDRPGTGADGEGLSRTDLLHVFLKICDAVAFAHSKGVVHRDLKPENVMIGAFGEVLVMDWGLAKVLAEKPEVVPRSESRVPGSLPESTRRGGQLETRNPELDTHGSRTLEGDVMGTPAYMPPEQATGRIAEIDARTDVFALGGILYRILTHEHPYEGDTALETLQKAQQGELITPRKRSPWLGIPAELESIVLHAMSPARHGRYPDALSLAEDVRAFLDRRLVSVHRYGPGARFVRFVQRHPTVSIATALVLLFLAAGTALTGVLLERARTNAARAEAERLKRAEAEAQREKAEQAREIEALHARQAEMERDQAVTTMKKGRLVAAMLRAAYFEIGDVMRALKGAHHTGASRSERKAVWKRYAPSVTAFEKRLPEDKTSVATWLAVKGWLLYFAGDDGEAFGLFKKSSAVDPDVAHGPLFGAMVWLSRYFVEQPLPGFTMDPTGLEFDEVPRESPRAAEWRADFANMLSFVKADSVWGESSAADFSAVLEGFRYLHAGDLEGAETGLTRALGVAEMVWLREEILYARAKVRFLRKNFDGALADARRLLDVLPRCLLAHQLVGKVLFGIAGESWTPDARTEELLEKAIAAFSEVIRISPRNRDAHDDRGLAYASLARVRAMRSKDYEEQARLAVADFDRLASTVDPDLSVFTNRANALVLQGIATDMDGRDPRPLFERGLADAKQALKMNPKAPEAHIIQAIALSFIADEEEIAGRDGSALLDRALAAFDGAAAADPTYFRAHLDKGKLLLRLGRRAEAQAAFQRALTLVDDGERPEMQRMIMSLGLSVNMEWGGYAMKAKTDRDRGDFRAALKFYEKSLMLARRTGMDRKRANRRMVISIRINLAALHALASAGVFENGKPPLAISEKTREAHRQRCVVHLRRAMEMGSKSLEAVRDGAEFGPVRDYAPFKNLLAAWQKKRDESSGGGGGEDRK